jgi:hypothetical protein
MYFVFLGGCLVLKQCFTITVLPNNSKYDPNRIPIRIGGPWMFIRIRQNYGNPDPQYCLCPSDAFQCIFLTGPALFIPAFAFWLYSNDNYLSPAKYGSGESPASWRKASPTTTTSSGTPSRTRRAAVSGDAPTRSWTLTRCWSRRSACWRNHRPGSRQLRHRPPSRRQSP